MVQLATKTKVLSSTRWRSQACYFCFYCCHQTGESLLCLFHHFKQHQRNVSNLNSTLGREQPLVFGCRPNSSSFKGRNTPDSRSRHMMDTHLVSIKCLHPHKKTSPQRPTQTRRSKHPGQRSKGTDGSNELGDREALKNCSEHPLNLF